MYLFEMRCVKWCFQKKFPEVVFQLLSHLNFQRLADNSLALPLRPQDIHTDFNETFDSGWEKYI